MCELAKQCVAKKVSIKLEKLSESEISKWKKGKLSLKTVKTPYNFVYTTTKMLDVEKIEMSKNLEKRPKEKKMLQPKNVKFAHDIFSLIQYLQIHIFFTKHILFPFNGAAKCLFLRK